MADLEKEPKRKPFTLINNPDYVPPVPQLPPLPEHVIDAVYEAILSDSGVSAPVDPKIMTLKEHRQARIEKLGLEVVPPPVDVSGEPLV